MKKHIMIALGMALLPGLAFAADFSGAWVRDAAKSDPASYPVYWITRDPPAPGGGGNEVVVQIQQSGDSVRITDPARRLRVYPLDGRPRTVPTETNLQQASVTAAMQGDALVVASTEPYSGLPGSIATNIRETWSLSPDGRVLTVTTVRTTPAAAQTSRQVYNKR